MRRLDFLDDMVPPVVPEMDPGGGTPIFSLLAQLDVNIGNLAKQSDKLAQRRPPMQPVFYRVAQTLLVPSNGFGVVAMGGPDQGHMWHVRSLVVGGLSPTTAATGRADIFVSAGSLLGATSLDLLGIQDWRDQSIALPNVAFYSNGDLTARLNEEVFVVFSGATPGQMLVATCQVEDVEEAAIGQAWSF